MVVEYYQLSVVEAMFRKLEKKLMKTSNMLTLRIHTAELILEFISKIKKSLALKESFMLSFLCFLEFFKSYWTIVIY
ncbi:hypothetical protein CNEO3_730003 [Clostridium neonatale]|uniref:Uncharacterized protein n=1 Tax=Clostridium neonatale TaxID=137838 RepID=A0AA86JHL6_9CLOT|nr:hypothetical protein CNEO_42309 [Clostridium neonatale]CAG9713058.1 hypothetical protein CNEO_510022 [Clostridium neonatale]CAI3194785.1 hypothetical protein CNEO2_120070 [Clostridium neonatale]CAI3205502.1 hypothetical protein CNEO2_30081 [Clostridium neonatale]CAI3213596.1 hypothetical protein CNEO2_660004 [Clostridium neonatale]